jgi:hypothetical protein
MERKPTIVMIPVGADDPTGALLIRVLPPEEGKGCTG